MKHNHELRVRIKTFWAGLLSIILFGVLLFWVLTKYSEDYEISIYHIFTYLTCSVAIFTLLYHSATLENRMEYQKKSFYLNKSKYSYDICAEWHNPLMQESIEKARELIHSNKESLKTKEGAVKFQELLNGNEKANRRHLILILNYFEHIAIMINKDHIDEKIIKYNFGTLFKSYYESLKNYIDLRQKEYYHSWKYFEDISKKWLSLDRME